MAACVFTAFPHQGQNGKGLFSASLWVYPPPLGLFSTTAFSFIGKAEKSIVLSF
jgi:hypothetical protein